MADAPPICVLMPVYNGQRYLRAAVQSVLDQTFRAFELIVVDDGSKDQTPRIIQDIAGRDPRVRMIRQENTGICGALNNGIAATTSAWIARMDADDIARPERLALQWDYLQKHPECVLLGGQVDLIDPKGWPIALKGPEPTDHDTIDQQLLAGKWPLVHPTLVLSREAVLAVGGYRHDLFPAEDHDLFLRLAEHGRVANLPDTLLDYRLHPKSVSHTSLAKQYAKIELALAEAAQRRGMPERRSKRNHAKPFSDQGLVHARWAKQARTAGNMWTARKHVLLACLKSPTNLDYWKLAAETFTRATTPQPITTGAR